MFDLAIDIIIGGACGKLVSSLIENLLMPPIGYMIGKTNFRRLNIHPKK